MAANASNENCLYLQKCMEICQLFVSEDDKNNKKDFFFNLDIKNVFRLTVNHSNQKNKHDDKAAKAKNTRKYVSPSNRRRNATRLAAFKAKKANAMNNSGKTPSSEEISPLEPPGVGGSPPGSLPGEDEKTIKTRDDPTNLETRRVDVPLVGGVDVHPPPIPPLPM